MPLLAWLMLGGVMLVCTEDASEDDVLLLDDIVVKLLTVGWRRGSGFLNSDFLAHVGPFFSCEEDTLREPKSQS